MGCSLNIVAKLPSLESAPFLEGIVRASSTAALVLVSFCIDMSTF